MNKSALRTFYKEKRTQLDENEINSSSRLIANNLEKAFDFENELISVFLPISRLQEIDTRFIIEKFSLTNTFCSPVANFSDHTMKHVELNGETRLMENEWGIPEPSQGHSFKPQDISVVFVPLLISDIHGNRLGYGKGFYDRFLAEVRNDALIVGINYFKPIDLLPEIHSFDVPLQYLVTPEKIFKSE